MICEVLSVWLGKPRLYTFMASMVLTLIEQKLSDIGVKRFGQAVAVCAVYCTNFRNYICKYI